ncbi:hypothetical protein GCM10025881_13720 [Pseudolysinimonas kribbensis]|uniref:Glucose-methanol-choline oxidoreductase N-terminal domain-containing protein n=1 Tax=Pseudolysinimonas kribbensis TaxID=433641 RepID=A0ABQ6K4S7_9MICO|nr:hypothetical protein [Pseudolysinimonas kribbensis]GMA94548.1 hypothetical protein GCM10025881_13720 [Pseudolysinimonas kribbensis]
MTTWTAEAAVRERNDSAWLLDERGALPHGLRRDMRRFDDADEVDIAIVGAGAGGSTLLQRLARAGWRGSPSTPGRSGIRTPTG